MSVNIYFSSSQELLAEKLAENLSTERRINSEPFLTSRVMVPNINLKQWLQLQIVTWKPDLLQMCTVRSIDDLLSCCFRDTGCLA